MNKSRKKLSRTVLEMKFMKRTKILQDKHDDETENIELLTNRKVAGIHSNFVVERNWELIEKLRSSRLNYGMSRKQHDMSSAQKPATTQQNRGEREEEEQREDYEPKAKHIRYNDEDDNDY